MLTRSGCFAFTQDDDGEEEEETSTEGFDINQWHFFKDIETRFHSIEMVPQFRGRRIS